MTRRPVAASGVLLVTDGFPIGGLERVMVGLAGELLARGRQVTVLADAGGAMWAEVPQECGRVPVRLRPGVPAALSRFLALRDQLRGGRFGVVHAHQRGVALLARIAAVGTGAVVVEHVHNVFAPTPAARLLSFRGSVVIACANPIGRMLVDTFHRPASRVRVVVNGVADAGARPREPRTTLRLVGAGRLTDQKDPLRFVGVVAALVRRRPPGTVSAVWLGDGPLMAEVRRARDAAGLEHLLELPGLVPDPAARLAGADCLLLTSRHEGLPLVALEALSVGRGAVLPDVGGCSDAIDDATGLLYDADLDVDALADLLDSRLTEPALAAWAGAARGRYERRFTFERMADEVLDVYGELAPVAEPGLARSGR